MRKPRSPAFAEWVNGPINARGLSNRQADRLTGVNYATISNMADGQIPEMESVVKYAIGLNLDVNEGLRLAGYPPLPEADLPVSGSDVLLDGLHELQGEFPDVLIPAPRLHGGASSLTPEEAESILDDLRGKIEQGELPKNS